MAQRNVAVKFTAEIQGFKTAMAEAAASTQKVKKASEESSKSSDTSMGKMVQSATTNRDAWEKSGATLMGFGVAAVAGVGLAVKSFAEFDKQMSSVQAATHATGGEMSQLRELAITAGADTSFSAREAAEGIEELSKAGVSTADVLKGGLTGALSLAAAGGLSVAEAAETAATALVQFKLSGDKVPHIADLLAAAAGNAQGSVSDMGQALKQAGLVAASTGLSIEETTGGLAAFASAGLIGSDAGTSFKSMLQRLTPQSKEAEKEMARLGISAYDSQGQFIGLSKFAGNLQESMKTLTPEARNAAMGIIFGSDAVRAANVLYEQGAAGISEWTDKVNSAGYAANTAAIMQDNLAGDFEKLTGSIDSVFLKSASSANGALRGMAQGAEDLVDAVGKIPEPILNASLGIGAIVGTTALAGGAFLTLAPRAIETVTAFKSLASEGSKVPGVLGKIGKAAGIAAAGMVALQIAGAIFNEKDTKSAEDYGQALLKVSKAGSDIDPSALDEVFKGWDKFAGEGPDIENLAGAVKEVVNPHIPAGIQDTLDGLFGWTGTAKNDLGQVRDRLSGLGDAMGGLVRNGGAEAAAKSFAALSKEFENNGKTAQDALDTLPGYKDALQAQATAAGVTLDKYQLMDLALGVIPPALKEAAGATEEYTDASGKAQPVTEEMSKALAEVGLSAQGVIVDLNKLLESMFATGILTQSAADAESAYQDQLDELDASIKKVKDSQTANNQVLDAATGSWDLTTDAGQAANGVFGDLQRSAIATTEAMAANGATQPELQAKLGATYQSLKDTALGFGMSETKADDLARSALGIPKGVPIETAINNYADSMAKLQGLKEAADRLPTFKQLSVNVAYTESGTAIRDRVGDAGMSNMVQVQATGGKILGYSNGGQLPSTGPGTEVTDGFLAVDRFGIPVARVDKDEWIINGNSSNRYNRELAAINAGTFPKLPGYASGGREWSTQSLGHRPYMASGAAANVTNNWNISEQTDARVTAYEVARRQQSLSA